MEFLQLAKIFQPQFLTELLIRVTSEAVTKNKGFFANVTPPEDISVNGHLIDWLFNYVTFATIIFFFFVCLGLFGFAYFYRASKNKKPYYTYGDKRKHVLVVGAVGLAVFLSIDMNITRLSNIDFQTVFANWPDRKSNDVLKVEVMAQQWMWKFRYAGADGVFNTNDDVVTTNDLRLPINKKVVFQITSKDVIHSFFIPNARRKVDAMPGRISRMWAEFTKAGDWPIACAEMCGTHHYLMQAYLKTYSTEDFNKWYDQAKTYALSENDTENKDTFWGWSW